MNQEAILSTAFYIDNNVKLNIGRLQDRALFNYRLYKLQRLKAIADQRPFESGWRFITVKPWAKVLDGADWAKFEYIDNEYFEDVTPENIGDKVEFFKKSIFVCSNYPPHSGGEDKNVQTLRNFSAFYQMCPDTLFLGWDWDNHFNVHIGSVFAAASDIYYPSHRANDFELSQFCTHKYHMPASAYQWGRDFLIEHLDLILRRDRLHESFGRFSNYGLFGHRNDIVNTLAQNVPNVALASLMPYHGLSERQKLEEWTRYKAHWIVPTLNDVSTRIFDVLLTGGVLILPRRFQADPLLATIDERDRVFFDEDDVINPQALLARALARFDQGGLDGVLRRHRFAIDHHNLDSRVRDILRIARGVLAEQVPAG